MIDPCERAAPQAPEAGAIAFSAPPLRTLRRWFDSNAPAQDEETAERIDWLRAVPFIGMHIGCLGIFFTGVSPIAAWTALALYVLRMFAITAFYHRYFAHRTFRASRAVQFAFAVIGASGAQRGPLWWAAHHRNHHRHADTALDPHSPGIRGFFWSHMGWFLTPRAFRTDWQRIPDFAGYPELRWLDRYDVVVPGALALTLYLAGTLLARVAPGLHTDGAQMLVWGFFVSTTLLFHVTVTINSLAHRFGKRRFATRDDSRNNALLALLTFGEGWHNNHHFYPGSARQGFRWWEFDLTWIALRALAVCGLVSDLKPVPAWVFAKRRG
ncbi:MAG: acyl-CoA desaturase [Rudaea sp.]|uniref:acyl-CoA desaturase n=1 Tax=unclassified Rudaea TaxID=2627037 RepID=UPI0010F634BD|nr:MULTISPECIES: acyl-CoA desaturase [unclassified Rudaea]MBN8888181.1 acyl-CoA desaturase [Rudaea sp.]